MAPAQPWVFPRVALAVAAAVVLIIGAGYAAGRTAALDLRQTEARELRFTPSGELESLARCDGGGSIPMRMSAGKATILLAHTGSEIPAHRLGDVLHLARARAELERDIAVLLRRAVSNDLAIVELEHRDRHVIARVRKDASHAELLCDHAGAHCLSLFFLRA